MLLELEEDVFTGGNLFAKASPCFRSASCSDNVLEDVEGKLENGNNAGSCTETIHYHSVIFAVKLKIVSTCR